MRMTCAVCCHATDRSYKPGMAGGVGGFCWYCFLAWYEEGLTTDETIRARSIALREEGWRPGTTGALAR